MLNVFVSYVSTDVIVFIDDVIMCFTSDWPRNLRVTNSTGLIFFVDQGQFSDPDFISGTHQRGNVQFSHNNVCAEYSSMKTRRFFVQFWTTWIDKYKYIISIYW
jgi:hypothetical protein